ncbi:MAG: hypothetical protein V4773_13220 [Verrucomicrobiota bacterium]
MKHLKPLSVAALVFVAMGLVGCDRTVSKTEDVKTSSDGTMKSKETTVTQKADGTTVKTEETKKVTPAK